MAAYDLIIGLDLDEVSADGCITKAPCDGDKAGPSPVDRRKQELKRSMATEAGGGHWAWSRPVPTGTTLPAATHPRRWDDPGQAPAPIQLGKR